MSILKNLPTADRYVPAPVWSGVFLASGVERWEVLQLAKANEGAADAARKQARRARDLGEALKPGGIKWGFNKEWQKHIKRAVRWERHARILSERAEMWRRLAKQIPYPEIVS